MEAKDEFEIAMIAAIRDEDYEAGKRAGKARNG